MNNPITLKKELALHAAKVIRTDPGLRCANNHLRMHHATQELHDKLTSHAAPASDDPITLTDHELNILRAKLFRSGQDGGSNWNRCSRQALSNLNAAVTKARTRAAA